MSPSSRHEHQRGFTLIELSIGMAISTIVLGAVILVQSTAKTGFNSSMNEQRMTGVIRTGMKEVKREVRSALSTSIQIPPAGGTGDGPVFIFQHAVGFDAANGETIWGGGTVPDGKVKYTISGTTLERRVFDDADNLVPSETKVLFENLDLNPPNGEKTIQVLWSNSQNTIDFTAHVRIDSGGHIIQREVATVLHIHSVFNF